MTRPSPSSLAVIGSNGRLGAALARHFEAIGWRVERFGRDRLDLAEPDSVERACAGLEVDALCVTAALTAVDYCETHAAEAYRVNAESPGRLAALAAGRGWRTIHVSTDYVYDGTRPGARSEEDPLRPAGVYGESKRAGEEAVLAADPAALVLRTSWVFGPDRPSFLDMILERALSEPRVEAVDDKFSAPCYSIDFGAWLEALLAVPDASGIFNLCNEGACSWRQYGEAALEAAARAGVPLAARTVDPIRLADLTRMVAPRPVHTAMSVDRFAGTTGIRPRPWREAVEAYLRDHWVPRHREEAAETAPSPPA